MDDDQFSGRKVSLAITQAVGAAIGEDSVLHDSTEYASNMALWQPILTLIKEGKDIPCLWYYLQNGSEYKESALGPFISKRKYETMRGLFQSSKERLEELSVVTD